MQLVKLDKVVATWLGYLPKSADRMQREKGILPEEIRAIRFLVEGQVREDYIEIVEELVSSGRLSEESGKHVINRAYRRV